MATGKVRKWEGGYVWRSKRGAETFVIERHLGGRYFKISTRCHTAEAALAELARWEKDPYAYRPGLVVGKVEMTDELVLEYVRFQTEVKGNTREWAAICRNVLADWLEDFDGLDLRSLTAHGHIRPALRSRDTVRHHRMAALKGFFRWLRVEKGLVKHSEDATLDVPIPKQGSSRLEAPRDVPVGDVRKVAAVFTRESGSPREMKARAQMLNLMALLQGTGWHVSEARRFAINGEIRPDPTGQHLAVLVTWHKRKEFASTFAQNEETLEAARFIRKLGRVFSDNTTAIRMREACRLAEVEAFGLGDLRHSTATWAAEDGTDQEEIARALNHSSSKTTRQHYIRHRIPLGVMKVRPLRLVQ